MTFHSKCLGVTVRSELVRITGEYQVLDSNVVLSRAPTQRCNPKIRRYDSHIMYNTIQIQINPKLLNKKFNLETFLAVDFILLTIAIDLGKFSQYLFFAFRLALVL